jgi:hypothetical protein
VCGILAVLSKTGALDAAVCRRAVVSMYWRGPDFAASSLWENRVFLGQTVLSITGDPLKRLFLRRYPAVLLVEKQGFAGFPNEAAAWLGEPSDWLAPPFLGIEMASLETGWADRATVWKLINVEYFLRHLA